MNEPRAITSRNFRKRFRNPGVDKVHEYIRTRSRSDAVHEGRVRRCVKSGLYLTLEDREIRRVGHSVRGEFHVATLPHLNQPPSQKPTGAEDKCLRMGRSIHQVSLTERCVAEDLRSPPVGQGPSMRTS